MQSLVSWWVLIVRWMITKCSATQELDFLRDRQYWWSRKKSAENIFNTICGLFKSIKRYILRLKFKFSTFYETINITTNLISYEISYNKKNNLSTPTPPIPKIDQLFALREEFTWFAKSNGECWVDTPTKTMGNDYVTSISWTSSIFVSFENEKIISSSSEWDSFCNPSITRCWIGGRTISLNFTVPAE